MSERLAIAGSGAIACGLAAVAATQGHVTVFARSEGSCDKADAKVRAICERLGASVNGNVLVSRDPAVLRGRHVRRRGDRRGPARQGRDLEAPRRAPGRRRRARHDDLLAADRRARRGQRPPRALRRPARLQPGAEDGPDRARVPGRRQRRHPRAGARAVRGAGQDRGRGPRHAGLRRQPPAVPVPVRGRAADGAHRAWTPRRSTPACAWAPVTRWARSRCWTSSGSTSAPRSRARSASRCPPASDELIAAGALGRKTGRGFYTY